MTKQEKQPTVTIGIPAYNEAETIEALLRAVISQRQTGFTLTDIIVVSDASTDGTDDRVRAFENEHPEVRLERGNERKGKYFRVNQLFRMCASDVLIVLDADIAPSGDGFLETLVSTLTEDTDVMMVSAYQIPLRSDGFIGRVLHAHITLWDEARLSLPNPHRAVNFYGNATAYRNAFFRSIAIPETLVDPHLYLYLAAEQRNGFRFCRDAEVVYWPFSTMGDFKKLLRRSIGTHDDELERLFGDAARTAYVIPRCSKVLGVLRSIRKYPLHVPFAILLTLVIPFLPVKRKQETPIWDILRSTKKQIPRAIAEPEHQKT